MNISLTIIFAIMTGACLLALIESLRRCEAPQQYNPYLTGLLLLILMHTLGELFIASAGYKYAPHLAGMQLPIRMLLGPALYLYAKSMMSSPPRLWLIGGTAMLGPLVVAIIMLPFANLSAADKLALANPATRDPELFRLAWVTCCSAAGAFIAFTSLYWVMTFKLQKRHRQRIMQRYANIEKRALDWLKYSLYVWGLLWLFLA
ncbi:hypothetical protein [Marinagarivorans cellulosilyticus]|nr:hypothetical protein [Marinagarivorans cellulosilyticus]